MRFGDIAESFGSSDEVILDCASKRAGFPQLAAIRRDFYKDVRIYPDISRALVRELREIGQALGCQSRCAELATFFERAAESGATVYCVSD